ncbi:cytochrome c oxidase subunit 5B, mitochondrial [Drosophila busckii]|uniref:cytochrome c oxidase subunit 5B, mitochondrial n=1 Tax=Drosophila busckii TaxID=30019 RepID=UPI0014332F92|nr:cytochrome c oxidase subunit 5B, mitochondrial [Drosophila busckii]
MSSFISRLAKSTAASKRLVSQLTQRSEGKMGALLRQLGLDRILGGLGNKAGRAISTTPVLKAGMIDDIELATGIFKREKLLREAGCNDPWAMSKAMRRGSGRKNDPTMIPSALGGRMVGCLCGIERGPKWMWLESGDPVRCECGHYFQIKYVPPV